MLGLCPEFNLQAIGLLVGLYWLYWFLSLSDPSFPAQCLTEGGEFCALAFSPVSPQIKSELQNRNTGESNTFSAHVLVDHC